MKEQDTDREQELRRIQRRQVARFLDHLHRTGQYTEQLCKDVKRSYGFAFADVSELLQTVENKNKTTCETCDNFDENEASGQAFCAELQVPIDGLANKDMGGSSAQRSS